MSKVYSPADVERVEAELASALEWNKAHVTVRDEIWRAIGCGWSESVVDAAKRVVAERDAALAELAALKKRIAESPIGAVEVYEVQRYVGGKRVAVKLPESFEHGAVVRVVRVLAEDTK